MALIKCFCQQKYNYKNEGDSKINDDKLRVRLNQDYFVSKYQKDKQKVVRVFYLPSFAVLPPMTLESNLSEKRI